MRWMCRRWTKRIKMLPANAISRLPVLVVGKVPLPHKVILDVLLHAHFSGVEGTCA